MSWDFYHIYILLPWQMSFWDVSFKEGKGNMFFNKWRRGNSAHCVRDKSCSKLVRGTKNKAKILDHYKYKTNLECVACDIYWKSGFQIWISSPGFVLFACWETYWDSGSWRSYLVLIAVDWRNNYGDYSSHFWEKLVKKISDEEEKETWRNWGLTVFWLSRGMYFSYLGWTVGWRNGAKSYWGAGQGLPLEC